MTRMLLCCLMLVASQAGAQELAQPQRGARNDSANRARLESEIRRGFARVVRNRVGLTDAQMARLGPLSQKYEQQRRQLQMEERDARTTLRRTMRSERTADSAEVSRLLRTLVELQQRRTHILAAEQIELATIMTPIQRAKFMAMQEQIRRRLEQMRQRRLPLADGEDGLGPPPRQRRPF